MVEISELKEEDVQRYTKIFFCARDLFGDFTGEYYKLMINGVEHVLHVVDNVHTIYEMSEDGGIGYQMFAVDDDYNVVQVGYDDFELTIGDGQAFIEKRDKSAEYSLTVQSRGNGEDFDGFDGLIIFAQYDAKKDKRVVMTYQQMYMERNKRIYDSRIKSPFSVIIEDKIKAKMSVGKEPKTKMYIRRTFDYRDEPGYFNIVTIKDFGLAAVLEQGPVALQKEDRVTRYYKVLYMADNYECVSGFPFCKQYTQGDIEQVVESEGFSSKIPEFLLKLYNGDDDILSLCREVAELIKQLNMENDETRQLTLDIKVGGSNQNETN